MRPPPEKLPPRIRKLVDLLIDQSSADYDTTVRRLRAARQVLEEELACQIEGPLNERLAKMPLMDYDNKKEASKFINNILGSLGLHCRCPKTGEPAFIVGSMGNGNNPGGRFLFQSLKRGKAGKYAQTCSSTALPHIVPMPNSEEPIEVWVKRATPSPDKGRSH